VAPLAVYNFEVSGLGFFDLVPATCCANPHGFLHYLAADQHNVRLLHTVRDKLRTL
jgi:hypothetical protein